MATQVTTMVLLSAIAAGLILLGRWGRAHALTLVPTALPDDERHKRAAVVRRGGLVCYAAAVVMAAAAALAVV